MSGWHPDMPPEYRNRIVTGDARLLAERIPDESVDLIMADPVYERLEDYLWLGCAAARVLKPDRACLMWQGQQWLDKAILALAATPLRYRWVLGWYASNNMQMVGRIGRKIAPLLWYEKGHSNPHGACREVVDVPIPSGQAAPFKWSKNAKAVRHYLSRFCREGDVVWDPFCGLGTTAVVCRELGLHFIGSEIDPPPRGEAAAERLHHTPRPLLLPEMPEAQGEFAL